MSGPLQRGSPKLGQVIVEHAFYLVVPFALVLDQLIMWRELEDDGCSRVSLPVALVLPQFVSDVHVLTDVADVTNADLAEEEDVLAVFRMIPSGEIAVRKAHRPDLALTEVQKGPILELLATAQMTMPSTTQ